MTPFFVLIKCELGRSYEVATALADAEIASEIYTTAGDYDLLVKFYVEAGADIGHFVNEKVQTIPGIQDLHTELAVDVPHVQVKPDLVKAARYGLKPGDIRRAAALQHQHREALLARQEIAIEGAK